MNTDKPTCNNWMQCILFLLSPLFIVLSCKSTKDDYYNTWVERSETEIFNTLNKNKLDFEYAEIKGSVSYKGPDLSGSGSILIRMKNDSVVWFVIKKLGIEAIRGQIRPDSFFVLNRIEKTIEKGTLTRFNSILPNTNSISDYQNLLLGIINFDRNRVQSIYRDMNNYCLIVEDAEKKSNYCLSSADLKLRNVQMSTYDTDIRINFGKYKSFKKGITAPSLTLIEQINELGENSFTEIVIKEISFTNSLQMPFSIPRHYQDASE